MCAQGIIDDFDEQLAAASEGVSSKEEEQRIQTVRKAEAEKLYNDLCTRKGKIEAECVTQRNIIAGRENNERSLVNKYRGSNDQIQALVTIYAAVL